LILIRLSRFTLILYPPFVRTSTYLRRSTTQTEKVITSRATKLAQIPIITKFADFYYSGQIEFWLGFQESVVKKASRKWSTSGEW
jgi:hypothetical protein